MISSTVYSVGAILCSVYDKGLFLPYYKYLDKMFLDIHKTHQMVSPINSPDWRFRPITYKVKFKDAQVMFFNVLHSIEV